MKMKALVALLVAAGIAVPAAALAEDRLSLSGEMRVRGFWADQDFQVNGVDDANNGSNAWNDQRLRVAGKLAVADGVSVNFRFDATESDENSSNAVAWGGSKSTGYAPYSHRRGDIQFDKAYLQVVKNGISLSAGQMYFGGFGTGRLLDTVGTGLSVGYDQLVVHHVKQYDDNNGNDSYAASNSADERTLTAAKYTIKAGDMTVVPMVSYVQDAGSDLDRLGLGAYLTANFGPVAFKGEVDMFDGETAAGASEKGLQFYLDGSVKASDAMKVGVMAFYAQGQNDDVQVSTQSMPIFADWHPECYGPWTTEFVNEFNVYDPSGLGLGVMALSVYSDINVSEDLKLQVAGMYFMNEEETFANNTEVDYDGITLNAAASYKLASNTTVTAHAYYLDASGDKSLDVELQDLALITGIQVKF